MKNSPTDKFEKPLEAHHAAKKSLTATLTMQASKATRLNELSIKGDLNDKAVITEIGELQVYEALFPQRIPALEQLIVETEDAALRAVNAFISAELGPRVRELAAKTRASVADQLRSLMQPGQSLDLAVTQSIPVREVEALSIAMASLPFGGVDAHAGRVSDAWRKLEQLEAQS